MTKKNVILTAVCGAAFVALLCIATFYDLKISIALGSAKSVFGQFFEKMGELPTYIGVAASALILYRAVGKDHKFRKWLKPILLVVTYAAFFLLCWFIADTFFIDIKWIYLYEAIFALILCGFALLLTAKVDQKIWEKLVYFAAVTVFAVLIMQCLGLALNAIWTRQRFRNIHAGNYPGGSTEGFTPWYQPTVGKHDAAALFTDAEGKEDAEAYNSFPNAQTLGATALFTLLTLPEVFQGLKKYKPLFFVCPCVLVVMTAIGNIVARGAYLSDVLFALVIGCGGILLARFLSKLILRKNAAITSALANVKSSD